MELFLVVQGGEATALFVVWLFIRPFLFTFVIMLYVSCYTEQGAHSNALARTARCSISTRSICPVKISLSRQKFLTAALTESVSPPPTPVSRAGVESADSQFEVESRYLACPRFLAPLCQLFDDAVAALRTALIFDAVSPRPPCHPSPPPLRHPAIQLRTTSLRSHVTTILSAPALTTNYVAGGPLRPLPTSAAHQTLDCVISNVVVPGVMVLCGVLGGDAGGLVGTCFCEIVVMAAGTLTLIGLAHSKTKSPAETVRSLAARQERQNLLQFFGELTKCTSEEEVLDSAARAIASFLRGSARAVVVGTVSRSPTTGCAHTHTHNTLSLCAQVALVYCT